MSKRKNEETDLTDAEVAEIEESLPRSVKEANTQLLSRTQGGKTPCWVVVYRRRGMVNAVFRDLEAPYRKGEPALVQVTESIRMGDRSVSVWEIHYHDKVSSDYPQNVILPIEEYVWRLYDGDIIGTQYCIRKNKKRG